jgi:hypothetical protein
VPPSPLPVLTIAFSSRDSCSCSRYTTSPTGPPRVRGPYRAAPHPGNARRVGARIGQRGASGRFQLAGSRCGNGRIEPHTRAYLVKRNVGRIVTKTYLRGGRRPSPRGVSGKLKLSQTAALAARPRSERRGGAGPSGLIPRCARALAGASPSGWCRGHDRRPGGRALYWP